MSLKEQNILSLILCIFFTYKSQVQYLQKYHLCVSGNKITAIPLLQNNKKIQLNTLNVTVMCAIYIYIFIN